MTRALSRISLAALPAILAMAFAPLKAAGQEPGAASVLHAETQLVLVDVTVTDRSGNPVHGLKREDFSLTEDKQAQAIHSFDEHSSQTKAQADPAMPPMPPGTFTNYTPVPSSGALNVLLLDSLNTPIADQTYAQSQLRDYVKKASPGTRIAIFGLTQRLFLLQGFTTDPQVLKSIVERKSLARGTALLPLADGTDGIDPLSDNGGAAASGAAAQSLANLKQFEAEQKAFQTDLRVQYTLDAFNDLAHYLAAFPGRKNIIWFSGSFPLAISPDPTIEHPFAVVQTHGDEFRETTSLLSRAQVAVYPVDARGLMVDPAFSVANPTMNNATTSHHPGQQSVQFFKSQAEEHDTMSQLAEATGGKAFYNTNDLATAVEKAVESGSNYYTLAYSPTNKNTNGGYREIRVKLNGNLDAAGYTLSYRRGYYTDNSGTAAASAAGSSTSNYARASLSHGAPEPQEILFKVRVLPVGSGTEQALVPGNTTEAEHPIQPPFRRFAVDFAVVGSDIHLTPDKDGRLTGAISFHVLLYDNDGHLLNTAGKATPISLTPEAYKHFRAGLRAHFEISVPVKDASKRTNGFLRIGVHDMTSNRLGVVEIPVDSVAGLTPEPPTAAPAQTQPASGTPEQH